MPLICFTWGTSEEERRLKFPCDSCVDSFDAEYYRGITVEASPEIIHRILAQLRVTLNDFKTYQPSRPIPEAEELAVGREIMAFFEILSYENNRHITVRIRKGSRQSKVFGDVCVSYVIMPQEKDRCRLIVKYLISYPRLVGWLTRFLLPWGDLVMMRQQLLKIKRVSEEMQSRQVLS